MKGREGGVEWGRRDGWLLMLKKIINGYLQIHVPSS
jgi:hypothetical protein